MSKMYTFAETDNYQYSVFTGVEREVRRGADGPETVLHDVYILDVTRPGFLSPVVTVRTHFEEDLCTIVETVSRLLGEVVEYVPAEEDDEPYDTGDGMRDWWVDGHYIAAGGAGAAREVARDLYNYEPETVRPWVPEDN